MNNPYGKKIRQEVMIIKSKFLHDLKTKSRQIKPHGIYLTRKCFCQELFSLPHKNPLLALMLNLQLWKPDTDKKSFWKYKKVIEKKKKKLKAKDHQPNEPKHWPKSGQNYTYDQWVSDYLNLLGHEIIWIKVFKNGWGRIWGSTLKFLKVVFYKFYLVHSWIHLTHYIV